MENKKDVINPLVYALYRASEEFKAALEEYEKVGGIDTHLAETLGNNIHQVLANYKISIESLVDALPLKYRMLYSIAKNMKFDQVVDAVSSIVKEYGRGEDGSYKNFGETLEKMATKILLKSILSV